MMPSGERFEVSAQECFPSPAVTMPGFSGDHAILDASRTLAPSSLAKYWSAAVVDTAAYGWNADGGEAPSGALRLPSSSSLRRLRITAQSPRLSVTAQVNFTMPPESSAISAAAALRKFSA